MALQELNFLVLINAVTTINNLLLISAVTTMNSLLLIKCSNNTELLAPTKNSIAPIIEPFQKKIAILSY